MVPFSQNKFKHGFSSFKALLQYYSIIPVDSISSYYCREHLMQSSMLSSAICFCSRRQNLLSWIVNLIVVAKCTASIKILMFLIQKEKEIVDCLDRMRDA